MNFISRFLPLLAMPCLLCAASTPSEDFTDLTLEELAQIQVTSIARKHGSLFDTAAAAFVLTGEDIHRTGATDLASALRAVPGMQVGQIDPFNYAITTRGLNDSTSSKLLVLMDGRSLYSQTISGAHWNYHELFFEDVDRIETIRGPGATLWGANAVNGVINIVSKSAFSTLGSLLTATHGDRLDAIVGARHGWRVNASTAVRVYARYHEDNDFGRITTSGVNSWQTRLAGARLDWKRIAGGGFTLIVEGRAQRVASDTALPKLTPPFTEGRLETQRRDGGHVLGRWRQPLWTTGDLTVQTSFEQTESSQLTYSEEHKIFEADLQLSIRPLAGHDLLTGINIRRDADRLQGASTISFAEPGATTTFLGAFAQDEITLLPRRLSVTIGTKFERNSLTGWEILPNFRGLWRPSAHQRIWAAVSRAARTPSRGEREVTWFAVSVPPTPSVPIPTAIVARGSRSLRAEHVTAFELGHRIKYAPQLSVDTAIFVNRYRDLRGLRPTITPFVPVPSPHVNYSLDVLNNVRGDTYGGEVIARWRATSALAIEASTSVLRYDLQEERPPSMPELSVPGLVGSSPRHEHKLRANWDFRDDWTLDLSVRKVGALPQHDIPSYTGLDLHLGWRPRHDLEVEIVARDALASRRREAPSNFVFGTVRELSRSYYLRVTHRR